MAQIRSLYTRASLVRRRYHPSFSFILHDDDKQLNCIDEGPSEQGMSYLMQQRAFGSGFSNSSSFGLFQDRRCMDFSLSPSIGASFCRFMSTTVGEGSEKIELMSDVTNVLTDTTVQAAAMQSPAVNEVAVAAADSFLPIQVLQHFIDAVHSFTGLNW